MPELQKRLLMLISELRDEFRRLMNGEDLRHALVVHRETDDNPATDPNGLLVGSNAGPAIKLPSVGANHVIGFGSQFTVQKPIWNDDHPQLSSRTTSSVDCEAIGEQVATPALVAESFMVTNEWGPSCSARRQRFDELAADAGRLVNSFHRELCGIGLDYHDSRAPRDSDSRWLYFLHQLGWMKDPLSGVRVRRNTWVNRSSGMSWLPFENNALKQLMKMPFLQEVPEQIHIPPIRYVSEITQDLFRASVYALNDLQYFLEEFAGESLRTAAIQEERKDEAPKCGVFISYARKDSKWLTELLQMLSPAMRHGPINVWYDRKLKAGDDWRKEIQSALERANIGVLLVTPNFFASDFIQDNELAFLIEAAANSAVKLLWIPVQPSMHELSILEGIHAVGNPAEPWNKVTGYKRQTLIKQACMTILSEASALADQRRA